MAQQVGHMSNQIKEYQDTCVILEANQATKGTKLINQRIRKRQQER